MIYTFYQRLLPINKLIEVGECDLPDNRPVWKFAVKKPIEAFIYKSDSDMVPPGISIECHDYYRFPLGYVADVKIKIQ